MLNYCKNQCFKNQIGKRISAFIGSWFNWLNQSYNCLNQTLNKYILFPFHGVEYLITFFLTKNMFLSILFSFYLIHFTFILKPLCSKETPQVLRDGNNLLLKYTPSVLINMKHLIF